MATRYILPRHIVGGKFQQTLLEHLEVVKKQGGLVHNAVTQREHVQMLYALGEAVRGLAVDSLTLGRLILMQRHAGVGGDEYKPGSAQRRFLAHLGASPTKAGGPALLDELEYAATEDLIAAMNERVNQTRQREAAQVRTSMRSRYEDEVARAQASEDQAKAKVAGLEAQVAELAGITEFLRASRDKNFERARRHHAKSDPPGLYHTEQKNGAIVYEIKPPDPDGWETFEDRDKAIARLAELRGEEVNGAKANGAEPAKKEPPKKPKKSKPLRNRGILNPADLGD